MKGGMLRYRCRMCGEEYENTHVPNLSIALVCLTMNTPMPREWSGGIVVTVTDIHNHKDNSFGVADLIGGIQDKE